ncbi:hypothetical protein LCGC14_0909590 [marine sediment metagenome]|uniref:Uncharacterized protein n=1 Tax=marine sediment metagenome TaxID=412755 RepID=A0A0F9S0V0_9ZZZZ
METDKRQYKKRHCKCGNLLVSIREVTEEKCDHCLTFNK